MTYKTLVKFKKIYEEKGDKLNLDKVEKSLALYDKKEDKKQKK